MHPTNVSWQSYIYRAIECCNLETIIRRVEFFVPLYAMHNSKGLAVFDLKETSESNIFIKMWLDAIKYNQM